MAEHAQHRVFYCEVAAPETVGIMRKAFGPKYELWALPEDDVALEREGFSRADLILAGWRPAPGASIRAGKNIRLIYKLGAGIEKIDLQEAARQNIPVCAAGGSNAAQVAEHTILLMLALLRRLPEAERTLRQGQWLKNEFRPRLRSLSGRTVGIVGLGRIGRAVARRLAAFDTNLLYYDALRPTPEEEADMGVAYRQLPDLFDQADIVTLHVPLTPQTEGMIGRELLDRLHEEAILVNTSRGNVIDEAALVERLQTKQILGAGLDVFAQEPPDTSDALFALDNVIVTPHIAGSCRENIQMLAQAARRSYEAVLRGETPPDLVQAANGG